MVPLDDDKLTFLRQQKIMIGTPCYGGLLHEAYFRSCISLVSICKDLGISIYFASIYGESLISRARNEIVSLFINSDSSHLFFIDADIEFSTFDFIKLLLHDRDIMTGMYPVKFVDWSSIDIEKAKSSDDIQSMTVKYASNLKAGMPSGLSLDCQSDPIEVHDASTGFMCIKRQVIEKMIKAYPETRYISHDGLNGKESPPQERWALFDTMIDADGRYLSEDYTFCRRWQKISGKVWVDLSLVLGHIGTYVYNGYPVFE